MISFFLFLFIFIELNIKRSFFLDFAVGSCIFLITFIFVTIGFALNKGHYADINIRSPYSRFILSSKWLHFSFIQHKILLFQLKRQNLLPYSLIHFLMNLSNRHILEFDLFNWRFQHRLLQDYFISKWEPLYKEAVELKFRDALAYNSLGFNLIAKNNLRDAEIALQKSWELDNQKNYEALMNLGHIEFIKGNHKKAKENYETSLHHCEDIKLFFKGMDSDYNDLKLASHNISRETYDEILAQLRANITQKEKSD